jgi:ATP-binding cassette subfamily A (ABC1) protein 2
MYEAIIKQAGDDDEYEFKVKSSPFPVTNTLLQRKSGTDAGTIMFISATCYSMLLTTIIGNIVNERVTRLKHIQIISGMKLSAYWLANFTVDIVKMEITVIFNLLMFYANDI